MLKSTIAFLAIGAMQELTKREAIAKAKGEKAPLDVLKLPQSELIGQVIEHADTLGPFLAWVLENNRLDCVWDYDIAEHLGQCVASLILDEQPVNVLDLLRVRLEQTGEGLVIGWRDFKFQ